MITKYLRRIAKLVFGFSLKDFFEFQEFSKNILQVL